MLCTAEELAAILCLPPSKASEEGIGRSEKDVEIIQKDIKKSHDFRWLNSFW
jgi:hypothetical protein